MAALLQVREKIGGANEARGKELEPETRLYNSGMSGQQLRKSLA
jgi:hypothetical protein